MKTLQCLSRVLVVGCLLVGLLVSKVFAGCNVTAATNANTNPGVASTYSVTYTGNDSRVSADPVNHNLDQMEVSVWDQRANAVSFSWRYGASGVTGSMAYVNSQEYKFPDVALVEHQDNSTWYWYAIVVYGTGNINPYNCMYEVYRYNVPPINTWELCPGTTCCIPIPAPSGGNAVFDHAIRIDAIPNGDFGIIWDNETGIQAIGGSTSTLCGLCTNSYQLVTTDFGNNLVYALPDISLWTAAGIQTRAYYCYINIHDAKTLYVGYVKDLCNGVTYNYPNHQSWIAGTNCRYSKSGFWDDGRPRIACPTSSYCTDSWTVVSEYYNSSGSGTHDIIGYTSKCGSITGPNVYTDGTFSSLLCAANSSANNDPAVGYSNGNTNGLMIGWDNGNTMTGFSPTASVAVQCNWADGTPASYYLIVSANNCNNCGRHLSISGRDYNNDMQYTFWYFENPDSYVAYKDVAFGAASLKMANSNVLSEDNVNLSPNPAATTVTLSFPSLIAQIKVFDMTGNLLLNVTGNESAINNSLNELALNLPKGIYILNLGNEDGSDFVNKKFVKM